MTEKELVTALKTTGLPVRYSHFTSQQKPPYIVYYGNGQNISEADNTVYWKQNQYMVQFYFKKKDPAMEEAIESALTAAELIYSKTEDIWDESEGVFSIYYYV